MYNWDKNITNMDDLPVSPADMWELHHGGKARNHEVYGTMTQTITWTAGEKVGNGVEV